MGVHDKIVRFLLNRTLFCTTSATLTTENTRKQETALPCQRVLFYIWTGGRRVVSYFWVFPVAKYVRQQYSYRYPSYDSCLSCHIFTKWFQNNSTNFDTCEYFERYLTKIYPKESYFVIMERSEWSSRGLFLSFRLRTHRIAPNVTLFVQTFFNTLQNIPHSFFKYTNQIIYAPQILNILHSIWRV